MDNVARIETCEISDSELDAVSGGIAVGPVVVDAEVVVAPVVNATVGAVVSTVACANSAL